MDTLAKEVSSQGKVLNKLAGGMPRELGHEKVNLMLNSVEDLEELEATISTDKEARQALVLNCLYNTCI